jgi:regulator of sirC expression with transglutaminase-like and TPR domain
VTTIEAIRDQLTQAAAGPVDDVPLAHAALLIAQSEYPELDIDLYERRLQSIAERLEQELRTVGEPHSVRQIPLAVNRLLYQELGFRGNDAAYGDPRNLYLNDVLDERTGIPVTLALLYSEVCQRAGIDVRPVGLPGHVICRYQPAWSDEPSDSVLLDVFNGGRILSEHDCQLLVKNTFGSAQLFREYHLATLTPRQLLQRVLHNLKAAYLRQGDEDRAARVIELKLTLFPWDLDEIRDRGMLRERLGQYELALEDLDHYVSFRPGARDIATVRETLRSLRRHAGNAEDAGQPRARDLPN